MTEPMPKDEPYTFEMAQSDARRFAEVVCAPEGARWYAVQTPVDIGHDGTAWIACLKGNPEADFKGQF